MLSLLIIFIIHRLSNGLFERESEFIFSHIKLSNIKTSSNSVFYCIYHNLIIDTMEVDNIKCMDDTEHTSFIVFDSGENNNKLIIKNLTIQNSYSNGSVIKINGESNEINVIDSNINHVTSYDSIIKNRSLKVSLYICIFLYYFHIINF